MVILATDSGSLIGSEFKKKIGVFPDKMVNVYQEHTTKSQVVNEFLKSLSSPSATFITLESKWSLVGQCYCKQP